MLLSLSIRNYTLASQLEVDWQPGMTAITGETGAGKSLVLDALGMALGDRADTDTIRHGEDKAEVSALFNISKVASAQDWLKENDYEVGDECLLRRVYTREGRSRGYINGQAATMQQLQQLGELLIDIHSQHAHQSLLRPDSHRELLDSFGNHGKLVSEVSDSYQQWHTALQKLAALQNQSDELVARRDLLRFQTQEFDELSLQAGEYDALEQEQSQLASAEELLQMANQALTICREDDSGSLLSGTHQVVSLLDRLDNKPHALAEATTMLREAEIQIEEASREISHWLDSFEADPERLQFIDARLSAILQLARKHRVPPEELLATGQRLAEELADLEDGEGNLDALEAKVAQLEKSYITVAKSLTSARSKAAKKLAEGINAQLAALSMAGAKLEVELQPLTAGKFSRHGLENIEFLISTNPGQPTKPLRKVASGGELSRVSLAIQVVAAKHTAIPVLVFDEVDVGIGGATADVVGQLLRQLGERGQVICVTHQPQVAARAHQHLLASKRSEGKSVESSMQVLDHQQRSAELARMLGGAKVTEQTLAHAKEMLALGTS